MARQQPPCGLLRGEPLEHLGRRPDEGQLVRAYDLREPFVLRQKPVARMDGVAAGHDRCRDHGGRRKIGPSGIGRADTDGLVGQLHREAFAVGLAVGDDGLDAKGARGSHDAQGDLAPVGDQDLAEHQASSAAPDEPPPWPPDVTPASSIRTSS